MTDQPTVEDRLDRIEQALVYLAANHPEEMVYLHVQRVLGALDDASSAPDDD
jgi:hypothetical protein